MATSPIARAAQTRMRTESMRLDFHLGFLPKDWPIPPYPSPDLPYQVAITGGHIQLSPFFSNVFLLSNSLLHAIPDYWEGLAIPDYGEGSELLRSLLDRDASLTTALLQIRTSIVRAAWESLFRFSMDGSLKVWFRALTDIGIDNHWLDASQAGNCLHTAVEMEYYDTVTSVVLYLCDSGVNHWWRGNLKAILAACRKRNVECACLLIQHCDVNATNIRRRHEESMFQNLVSTYDDGNHGKDLALYLFLANGANVDECITWSSWRDKWRGLVHHRLEIYHVMRPTILDDVFYFHRSLFDKLAPYSTVLDSRITRTGLLVALEHGAQSLREYAVDRQSKTPSLNWQQHIPSLLELLLVEQFTVLRRVDLRIVRSLLEYGVDFEKRSVRLDVQDFWRTDDDRHWIRSRKAEHIEFAWRQFDIVHERVELLDMLLTRGGVLGECIFEGAVAQYGTRGLECLAVHPKTFPTKAVRALAVAARLNDFEAVDFLFRKRVDPDAFITSTTDDRSYSIHAVATGALRRKCEREHRTCSLEMMKFLAGHGAKLVVTPQDSTPFDFVKHLLRKDTSDVFAKVKYVLGTMMEIRTSSSLPAFLLESCFWQVSPRMCKDIEERLEIFEYLYRQGAEVSPGSPLAAIVHARGREELVGDVMSSGSNLNAYWDDGRDREWTPLQIAASHGDETLVRLFLREGADANSPSCGSRGVTALQAVCQWPLVNTKEHQLRMRICRLLIDQGADINAASARYGRTALGHAAMNGDLELAALLIHEGADVNAPSGRNPSSQPTALDDAACWGRLDMVKFLLNANALSAHRGASGYDGAVLKAVKDGHFAVADLIREHAAKIEAGTLFNPELEEPQELCRVDEDITDDRSSDDDAEDMDVAGGGGHLCGRTPSQATGRLRT